MSPSCALDSISVAYEEATLWVTSRTHRSTFKLLPSPLSRSSTLLTSLSSSLSSLSVLYLAGRWDRSPFELFHTQAMKENFSNIHVKAEELVEIKIQDGYSHNLCIMWLWWSIWDNSYSHINIGQHTLAHMWDTRELHITYFPNISPKCSCQITRVKSTVLWSYISQKVFECLLSLIMIRHIDFSSLNWWFPLWHWIILCFLLRLPPLIEHDTLHRFSKSTIHNNILCKFYELVKTVEPRPNGKAMTKTPCR